MLVFLSIIEILIAIVLTICILMQNSKSAGLSGTIAGGAETFFGKKRGLDEKLARISAVLAVLFFIVPIIMVIVER